MFAPESQTKTEDQPPTLAEIIREVTNNGQTIIDFLHDAMNGRLDGFEPCHRIAAARELAKRGDKQAIAFLQSFYPKSAGRKSNGRNPSPAIGEYLPDDELAPNHELAEIVREVTGNGRTIVHFLHDAMQGILYGFKPCHRVACAKELLRHGFDSSPGHTNDEYEDHDDIQLCHDEPFDHKKYAREQFWRDGADGKALAQIYGSEEAVSAALSAVRTHRRRTVLADAHIPDRDYTPIENPEDDPYGKGCFGYDTLRLSFNDNQAIRAANKAVAEYKKRMAESLETKEESADERPAVDRPHNSERPECHRNENNPDSPHIVLPAKERHPVHRYGAGTHGVGDGGGYARHENSQPGGNAPISSPRAALSDSEQPQNPPVGAGFNPARGLTHPSAERHSDPGEGPPGRRRRRKRPRKIHLGPPDE